MSKQYKRKRKAGQTCKIIACLSAVSTSNNFVEIRTHGAHWIILPTAKRTQSHSQTVNAAWPHSPRHKQ